MLTVHDIAEQLAISEAVVYGWVSAGLPHYRLGSVGRRGAIRVAEADLAAWIEGRKHQKRQEPIKSPPRRRPKLRHLVLPS